jgi:NAD(P)-dependent dehydrogenase (short-subunit alcohol dehydrogenase family)
MAKALLITGGARRLGREIVRAASMAGYDIALHYHQSQQDAESLQKLVEDNGRTCRVIAQDLRELDGLPGLIEQAQAQLPQLCALINNASTFRRLPFGEVTPSSFADDMRINFEAPFFLTQAFARHVKQGAVVNMLDAYINTHHGAYCSYLLAKKALANFTQMAALELADSFRVNAVCPGFILPSEGGGAQDPERLPPVGKPATAQQVAQAVLYALESDFMHGQFLYVDGAERLAR